MYKKANLYCAGILNERSSSHDQYARIHYDNQQIQLLIHFRSFIAGNYYLGRSVFNVNYQFILSKGIHTRTNICY